MVTSIIVMNVERALVNNIAEQLADRPEISEVYSVSGSYDLVAIVRVPNNDDLAKLVTEHLTQIDGIVHTETMLAFRAYSRHDPRGDVRDRGVTGPVLRDLHTP